MVDQEDLYDALKNGNLSYAILDVVDTEEPDLDNLDLIDLDNVVLTPHVAFYSQEAFIQGAKDNFKNLKAFLDGDYKNAEIVNLKQIELD
ncbi:MAG: NAD(P)-dependent oxidoreductase [Tissierellia bacterium]|nr:NAD(P)-dependent oxidoreductase [Tissierellia bacterium]